VVRMCCRGYEVLGLEQRDVMCRIDYNGEGDNDNKFVDIIVGR